MPYASIRPLDNAVEIRIHEKGGYGDDWQWGCVVAPRDPCGTVAWVTLAHDAPNDEQRLELARTLKDLGYTHAQWERRRGGVARMSREFRL